MDRGVRGAALEQSCRLPLRNEFRAMLRGAEAGLLAANAFLFEEFLVRKKQAGRLNFDLQAIPAKTALLHGHCHQKAFGVMNSVEEVLGWIPGLDTGTIESSCCGMAGAFGYEAKHYEVSMKMGELSLLPAVRKAGAATLIVADGTSYRHQIADGAGRSSQQVAVIPSQALV